MPLNNTAATATGRIYSFNQTATTFKVNFNPAQGATRYRDAVGGTEGWYIRSSGTLDIDPSIPTTGPTAFSMSAYIVGGGGGGGNLNLYFQPPSYSPTSPRQIQSAGGGGGGGIVFQPVTVDSNSFPIVIGAGGIGGNTGSSSYVGPLANPVYPPYVAGGGGAGGSVLPWTPPIPTATAGAAQPSTGKQGGSGGGSAGFWYAPTNPVFTYGSAREQTAGPAPAPGNGNVGANGRILTFWIAPPGLQIPVHATCGGGGGSSDPAPGGASIAASFGAPSPTSMAYIGVGQWVSGLRNGDTYYYGGGGAGGMIPRSPRTVPTDPYPIGGYVPTVNTLAEQFSTGGGGVWAPAPPLTSDVLSLDTTTAGIANTGGGGGGRVSIGNGFAPPLGVPFPSQTLQNRGSSGGSGVVLLEYPIASVS